MSFSSTNQSMGFCDCTLSRTVVCWFMYFIWFTYIQFTQNLAIALLASQLINIIAVTPFLYQPTRYDLFLMQNSIRTKIFIASIRRSYFVYCSSLFIYLSSTRYNRKLHLYSIVCSSMAHWNLANRITTFYVIRQMVWQSIGAKHQQPQKCRLSSAHGIISHFCWTNRVWAVMLRVKSMRWTTKWWTFWTIWKIVSAYTSVPFRIWILASNKGKRCFVVSFIFFREWFCKFSLFSLLIDFRVVPCNVFLLAEYPEHLLDLPYITEYKNSAEHPYIKKAFRKEVLNDRDFSPASASAA